MASIVITFDPGLRWIDDDSDEPVLLGHELWGELDTDDE